MSTATVSALAAPSPTTISDFRQDRKQDLKALSQALESGNLSLAQAAFNAANSLVPARAAGSNGSGPFPHNATLDSDFAAVGQALQAGDVAGAQQALSTLFKDATHHPLPAATPPSTVVSLSSSSGANTTAATGSASGSSSGASGAPSLTASSASTSPISSPSGNPTELVFNLGGAGSPSAIDFNFGSAAAGSQIEINLQGANGSQGESIGINIVA